MFDKLRCQLKQFDAAWKSGLIIVAVVLFFTILSRLTVTLDIDQDPVVRKKIVEILQHAKNHYVQAGQDANLDIALTNIGLAKGYLQSALMIASADQILKTVGINMTDFALRLDQRSELLRARIK
jgi:hypothetical protein